MEYYEDLTNVVNIIMGLYPNIPFTIIQCDREIVCIDEKVKRRWKGKLIHGRGTVLTPMIQRMVKNIKADVNIILTDLQIHSFDLPLSLQAKIKNPVWLLYGPRICMTNYPNKGLRIHVNGTKILKG
jgi:predicted metal-dependent peptidase